MKRLSVAIVNYNTRDLLHDCLKNIIENTDPSKTELIVVDNGSTDGSGEMVKSIFPQVYLIHSENKGLAVAGNLALTKSQGDYILYLGTDAYPKKDAINGLLDYMEKNPKVGICTAKLVTRDGSLDMDAHRGFPTPWTSFTHLTGISKIFKNSKLFNAYFGGSDIKLDTPHEIDMCISHFMLVRRTALNTVGGWDEDFFVFGEDVDLCWRVKQAKWKIMYLPQFSVLHFKGGSIGRKTTQDIVNKSTTDPETQKRMQKERARAMRLFYSKHMTQRYPGFINWLVLKAIDIRSFMRS